MATSDEDALRELLALPGCTPERQRLAEAVVGHGLGEEYDFAVAHYTYSGRSSSNSSAVFVVANESGRASLDPNLWDVLEPALRARLNRD